MWVRGLKLNVDNVAPYYYVAPYVGAWIETAYAVRATFESLSHPMWVRGLKLTSKSEIVIIRLSHPMWVRGLKPYEAWLHLQLNVSHPMWVRGLKRRSVEMLLQRCRSHPMWVRGLKLQNSLVNAQRKSRALCGCVD